MADDSDGFIDAEFQTGFPGVAGGGGFRVGGGEDVFFEVVLEFEFSQNGARGGADEEAAAYVGEGDGYAEFAGHEDDEVFVDDGGGDEKGEGDAEGGTGLEKADEDGDRGAGAKGGDGTEEGGDAVADDSAPAHPALEFFLGEPGAQHSDGEDHSCKEQEDFHGIVEKEVNGCVQPDFRIEAQPLVDYEVDSF